MATFNYQWWIASAGVFSGTVVVETSPDVHQSFNTYDVQYFVMDQTTPGASTKFWHEGMSNATPLSAQPTPAQLPWCTISGNDAASLEASLAARCQNLAARLAAPRGSSPLVIPAGYNKPVTVTV
jgi:hypothetical protein